MITTPALPVVSQDMVRACLREIFDPEIPVNIVDLGLIYNIEVSPDNEVLLTMTLTNPNCPMADIFPDMIQSKVLAIEGVQGISIDLVWDPPWDMSKMSEAAKLQLGIL